MKKIRVLSAALCIVPMLSIAPTVADAAVAPCGSLCDAKSPSFVYAGSSCQSDSIRVNGPSYPHAGLLKDPYFQVFLRYSPHCQTIWVETNNQLATGRNPCAVRIYNQEQSSETYIASGACDAAGGSTTYSPMANDYSPYGAAVGFGMVEETVPDAGTNSPNPSNSYDELFCDTPSY